MFYRMKHSCKVKDLYSELHTHAQKKACEKITLIKTENTDKILEISCKMFLKPK